MLAGEMKIRIHIADANPLREVAGSKSFPNDSISCAERRLIRKE